MRHSIEAQARQTSAMSAFRRGLIASAVGAIGASPVLAQVEPVTDEIIVEGSYRVERLSSPKFTLPLVDTPQTISIIPDQLLDEQGRRSLRDSLRNITGVSIQAGEGNPPIGGDAFNIRGLSARDDIFVDGVRDVGNYFRDPFFVERIEVFKGPSSAINGRGSVAGAVNFVTRTPGLETKHQLELTAGSADFYRAVGDSNFVLSEDNGIALRLTGLYHNADEPGRDFVNNERWGVAPSLAFGLGGDTRITVNYLHVDQSDLPDGGHPNARNPTLAGSGFEGRPAPTSRRSFFGQRSDFRDVTTNIVTARVEHDFSQAVSLRSQVRYGRTDFEGSSCNPRLIGPASGGPITTIDANTRVQCAQRGRDQADEILIGQTDLRADFSLFGFEHDVVVGGEISDESSENRRLLDVNGVPVLLADPVIRDVGTPFIVNGTRARLDTDAYAFYAFDTIELTPSLFLSGGLRFDRVKSRVRGFDDLGVAPAFVTDLEVTDNEISANGALIYKPTPNSSLYFAYGNAFESSGRSEVVQLGGGGAATPPVTAGSFLADPERTRAFELGGKVELADGRLLLNAAVFELGRVNARTPGVTVTGQPAFTVLDGRQRIRGLELGAVGEVTSFMNVFVGYTLLAGEVTRSNTPFEIGQRTDNTPEHSFSMWTSFKLTPRFSAGGGVQYVSERISNIQPSPTANIPITVDGFVVVDLFADYRLTDWLQLRANVFNVGNEEYFQAFDSAQSIPAAARSGTVSLVLSF